MLALYTAGQMNASHQKRTFGLFGYDARTAKYLETRTILWYYIIYI